MKNKITMIFAVIGLAAITMVSCSDDENQTPKATLTTNVVGKGKITVNPTGTSFEKNTEVSLKAESTENGWYFTEYTGDITSTNPEVTVTMDTDKTITANFKQSYLKYDNKTYNTKYALFEKYPNIHQVYYGFALSDTNDKSCSYLPLKNSSHTLYIELQPANGEVAGTYTITNSGFYASLDNVTDGNCNSTTGTEVENRNTTDYMLKVEKDGDIYTITYSFTSNGKKLEGKYVGPVEVVSGLLS